MSITDSPGPQDRLTLLIGLKETAGYKMTFPSINRDKNNSKLRKTVASDKFAALELRGEAAVRPLSCSTSLFSPEPGSLGKKQWRRPASKWDGRLRA